MSQRSLLWLVQQRGVVRSLKGRTTVAGQRTKARLGPLKEQRSASPGSEPRALTFAEYASTWLADRALKPRTRELYVRLLERRILPTFGTVPLTAITAPQVRRWHADQPAGDIPIGTFALD